MEPIIAYFVIWVAVIAIANTHYKNHMAKYGLDSHGKQISSAYHYHRRHDDK